MCISGQRGGGWCSLEYFDWGKLELTTDSVIFFCNIVGFLNNAQPFCHWFMIYNGVCVFVSERERVCEPQHGRRQPVYSAGLASSFFWDPSPQWHQHPPTGQPSPWHRTKTCVAGRWEGIMLDTFIGGDCGPRWCPAPLPHLLQSRPAVFVQPPALLTRSSKSLSDRALSVLSHFPFRSHPWSLSEYFLLTSLFLIFLPLSSFHSLGLSNGAGSQGQDACWRCDHPPGFV